MIKFTAEGKNGITIVGLGITEGNVELLKQGKPILVRLEEMGLQKYHFTIFFGETEAHLTGQLEKFIGPETKVYVDPKLKQ